MLDKGRVVILDLEGGGVHGEGISEIGLVEMIDGELTGRSFLKYIQPQNRPLNPTIIQKMRKMKVENQYLLGSTLSEFILEMMEFIQDSPVVGHNIQSDLNMLKSSLEQDDITISQAQELSKKLSQCYCTQEISKRLSREIPGGFIGSYVAKGSEISLNNLCAVLDVDTRNRRDNHSKKGVGHSSIFDCQLTGHCLAKMFKIKEWSAISPKKYELGRVRLLGGETTSKPPISIKCIHQKAWKIESHDDNQEVSIIKDDETIMRKVFNQQDISNVVDMVNFYMDNPLTSLEEVPTLRI